MATNDLSTKEKVCDAALALLRQDIGYASSNAIAAKCDHVWNIAWEAVRTAFKWTATMGDPGDTPPTDKTLRTLLVYSVARELAIPVAGRQEDLKTIDALFGSKVQAAKVKDLDAGVNAITDAEQKEVIGSLFEYVKADEKKPLPNSLEAIQKKVDFLKDACWSEVCQMFKDWASATKATTHAAYPAYLSLLKGKAALGLGLDANIVQLCQNEYLTKLNRAIKNALDDKIASGDAVLAQLVANFDEKDGKLAYCYEMYSNRKTAVATESESEVKQTLGIASLDALATTCAQCLTLAKLGNACGLGDNFVQLKMQEYNAKIQQWRKLKLDTTRTSDAVLDQLVGLFKGDDTALANAWSIYELRKTTVLTQCTSAVKEAFGVTDSTLDGVPALAANCLAVAKLAPAFGLDGSIQMQEYERLLVEYKQKTLADDVDDESSAIYTECLGEVKKTLGWTSGTVDDIMKACAKCLCYVRQGPRHGYDVNFVQVKEQEYNAKILQWRKLKLDEALKDNTDGILAQLLAPFKGDDTRLCNAFDIYTNKIATIASQCETEVRSQFTAWASDSTTTSVSNDTLTINQATYTASNTTLTLNWNTAKRWYPAWEALVKSKMALVMGLDANVVQLFEQEYKTKLAMGIKNELNDIMKSDSSEPILAQLLKNFAENDPGLLTAYTAYETRRDSVKTMSEETVKDALGVTTLTGRAAEAAVSLSVAKLAPACGLDANFAQLKMQEYEKLIASAKRDQLDALIDAASTTTDPFKTAADEVKKTLGDLTTLDAIALSAAKELCAAMFGERYGYDANYCQLKQQAYATKILQWRKLKLDEALKDNTDGILAQLLAPFKGDDTRLCNAFDIYTNKIATIASQCETEVRSQLVEWASDSTTTSVSNDTLTINQATYTASNTTLTLNWNTAKHWYPAWEALVKSKMAVAIGLDASAVQLYEQEYAAKLALGIKNELNERVSAVTDETAKSVLSQIVGTFYASDAKLPHSLASITDRIDNLAENARHDILLAHDWNFACVSEPVTSSPCEHTGDGYAHSYPFPATALKLVSVFGLRGKLNEWKVENNLIRAREPITKIRYLKDVSDTSRWAPLVKPLYVMRLKALVARTVMGNPQDAAVQEQLYERALQDAKLNDARESNTPNDPWGDNHYADAMRGMTGDFRREPPFWRR